MVDNFGAVNNMCLRPISPVFAAISNQLLRASPLLIK